MILECLAETFQRAFSGNFSLKIYYPTYKVVQYSIFNFSMHILNRRLAEKNYT